MTPARAEWTHLYPRHDFPPVRLGSWGQAGAPVGRPLLRGRPSTSCGYSIANPSLALAATVPGMLVSGRATDAELTRCAGSGPVARTQANQCVPPDTASAQPMLPYEPSDRIAR